MFGEGKNSVHVSCEIPLKWWSFYITSRSCTAHINGNKLNFPRITHFRIGSISHTFLSLSLHILHSYTTHCIYFKSRIISLFFGCKYNFSKSLNINILKYINSYSIYINRFRSIWIQKTLKSQSKKMKNAKMWMGQMLRLMLLGAIVIFVQCDRS